MSIRHLPYTALMILVTAAPVLYFLFQVPGTVHGHPAAGAHWIFRNCIHQFPFLCENFDKYIPEETSEPNPDSVVDHSLDSDNKNL